MNALITILFTLLIINLSVGQDSKTILLKPGKGIDDIILFKTPLKDVKKYKNKEYEIERGKIIACGEDSFFKRRISAKNSVIMIDFEYTSKYYKNPIYLPKRHLSSITIYDNQFAAFNNGITITKSTREQVLKAFGGMPNGWENEKYIRYNQKGVAFRFDQRGILVEVEIFEKNE